MKHMHIKFIHLNQTEYNNEEWRTGGSRIVPYTRQTK